MWPSRGSVAANAKPNRLASAKKIRISIPLPPPEETSAPSGGEREDTASRCDREGDAVRVARAQHTASATAANRVSPPLQSDVSDNLEPKRFRSQTLRSGKGNARDPKGPRRRESPGGRLKTAGISGSVGDSEVTASLEKESQKEPPKHTDRDTESSLTSVKPRLKRPESKKHSLSFQQSPKLLKQPESDQSSKVEQIELPKNKEQEEKSQHPEQGGNTRRARKDRRLSLQVKTTKQGDPLGKAIQLKQPISETRQSHSEKHSVEHSEKTGQVQKKHVGRLNHSWHLRHASESTDRVSQKKYGARLTRTRHLSQTVDSENLSPSVLPCILKEASTSEYHHLARGSSRHSSRLSSRVSSRVSSRISSRSRSSTRDCRRRRSHVAITKSQGSQTDQWCRVNLVDRLSKGRRFSDGRLSSNSRISLGVRPALVSVIANTALTSERSTAGQDVPDTSADDTAPPSKETARASKNLRPRPPIRPLQRTRTLLLAGGMRVEAGDASRATPARGAQRPNRRVDQQSPAQRSQASLNSQPSERSGRSASIVGRVPSPGGSLPRNVQSRAPDARSTSRPAREAAGSGTRQTAQGSTQAPARTRSASGTIPGGKGDARRNLSGSQRPGQRSAQKAATQRTATGQSPSAAPALRRPEAPRRNSEQHLRFSQTGSTFPNRSAHALPSTDSADAAKDAPLGKAHPPGKNAAQMRRQRDQAKRGDEELVLPKKKGAAAGGGLSRSAPLRTRSPAYNTTATPTPTPVSHTPSTQTQASLGHGPGISPMVYRHPQEPMVPMHAVGRMGSDHSGQPTGQSDSAVTLRQYQDLLTALTRDAVSVDSAGSDAPGVRGQGGRPTIMLTPEKYRQFLDAVSGQSRHEWRPPTARTRSASASGTEGLPPLSEERLVIASSLPARSFSPRPGAARQLQQQLQYLDADSESEVMGHIDAKPVSYNAVVPARRDMVPAGRRDLMSSGSRDVMPQRGVSPMGPMQPGVLREVRTDLRALRADVKEIKADVHGLRNDFRKMMSTGGRGMKRSTLTKDRDSMNFRGSGSIRDVNGKRRSVGGRKRYGARGRLYSVSQDKKFSGSLGDRRISSDLRASGSGKFTGRKRSSASYKLRGDGAGSVPRRSNKKKKKKGRFSKSLENYENDAQRHATPKAPRDTEVGRMRELERARSQMGNDDDDILMHQDFGPPGPSQHDPNMTGQRQQDTNIPGQRQYDTNIPGQRQLDTNAPGRRQQDTDPPGRRQLDTDPPGRRQLDTDTPGRRQLDTDTPGRRQLDTDSPGRRQHDTDTPGRRQLDTDTPGRRQLDTDGPGRRQYDTDGPGRRQFNTDGPGRRQPYSGGPGRRQIDTDGPGRRQFDSDGPGRRQFDSDGPGRRQFDTDGPGRRQFDSDGPGRRQFDTDGPGRKQFDSDGPGRRQPDSGGPGRRQFDTDGPGRRQLDTDGPGRRQPDSGGPGRRQPDGGGPGRRQFDSGGPGRRQLDTDGPDRRRPDSGGPGRRQSETGGPGRKQPDADTEARRKLETDPATQRRMQKDMAAKRLLEDEAARRSISDDDGPRRQWDQNASKWDRGGPRDLYSQNPNQTANQSRTGLERPHTQREDYSGYPSDPGYKPKLHGDPATERDSIDDYSSPSARRYHGDQNPSRRGEFGDRRGLGDNRRGNFIGNRRDRPARPGDVSRANPGDLYAYERGDRIMSPRHSDSRGENNNWKKKMEESMSSGRQISKSIDSRRQFDDSLATAARDDGPRRDHDDRRDHGGLADRRNFDPKDRGEHNQHWGRDEEVSKNAYAGSATRDKWIPGETEQETKPEADVAA